MRHILLATLAILLIWFNNAVGQTTFAASGTEWYNDHFDGYVHTISDGDTTILGKHCNRIRQELMVPVSSMAGGFPDIFTYSSGDTVFVYNELFSSFTPLYLFNVTEGDTIRIPAFYAPYTGSSVDTEMVFRIDSVRLEIYDSEWLKTVYTRTLNVDTVWPGSTVHSTYGNGAAGEWTGSYVEKLGRVHGGIFPSCIGCPVIPEDCRCMGGLRCFNDGSISLRFVSGDCAPMLNITPVVDAEYAHIYPNPATDWVRIDVGGGLCTSIVLFDLQERILLRTNGTNEIDLSNLPRGMYLLKVKTESSYYNLRLVKE